MNSKKIANNKSQEPATHRSALVPMLICLSLPIATSSGCVVTTDDDGLLTVTNDSSFIIDEIRVADVGSPVFGLDITGNTSLFPGEALTVVLDCDFYDVLFVDELALECVVLDVDVCFGRTVFSIDDRLLDDCAFSSGSRPSRDSR